MVGSWALAGLTAGLIAGTVCLVFEVVVTFGAVARGLQEASLAEAIALVVGIGLQIF